MDEDAASDKAAPWWRSLAVNPLAPLAADGAISLGTSRHDGGKCVGPGSRPARQAI